jgi:hypothetical protein
MYLKKDKIVSHVLNTFKNLKLFTTLGPFGTVSLDEPVSPIGPVAPFNLCTALTIFFIN